MNIERIVRQATNLKNNITETIAKEAGDTIKQAAESKITKAAALGIVASATGVMLANNAKNSTKENIKELKSLGLSDEVVGKMLSLKNSKNKPIFNSKTIKLLKETAEVEHKEFFYCVMKNIDNITTLKKEKDEDGTKTYTMLFKSPEGLPKGALMQIDEKGSVVRFYYEEKMEKGETLVSNKTFDNDKCDWREERCIYDKDNNVISREEIRRNHKNNSGISRLEYNPEDKKFESPIYIKRHVFTPEGVIDGVTETEGEYDSEGDLAKTKKVNINYKNNMAKTDFYRVGCFDEVKNLERTVKNPLTGKVEVQKMKLSDVPGVYNSVIIDEDGNEKVESLGRVNPDGSTYVEKNLESLDGVKTHYVREASKNEDNIKTFYQITDNDGKVLTTVDRTFKRISPTKAYSSINGHGYSIEKQEKAYVVTDLVSEKIYTIKHEDLFKDNESRKHPELIDKMSGDMLIDLFNRGYKYEYMPDVYKAIGKAKLSDRIIQSTPKMFTFAHEQGHTKDVYIDLKDRTNDRDNVTANPLFREEFAKERILFKEAFPAIQQEFIDYFIDQEDHYGGIDGGAREAVAEMNAIFSTASGENMYGTRTLYLQKYFPRSIAVAASLLNPNSNLYIENS